jgi:hypothetical protein
MSRGMPQRDAELAHAAAAIEKAWMCGWAALGGSPPWHTRLNQSIKSAGLLEAKAVVCRV